MAYIANKWNSAQITNIHYWDSVGGAWSGNLVGAATPFALLPNPVNANDFVIFGIDTSVVDSGPFNSLVFDIQVPNVAAIVWKYSDAGGGVLPTAWAPIVAFQDNTNQDGVGGGVAFDTVGIRSVHWIPDALWIAQNPTVGGVALGVTGLWICADVTGGAGGAPPTQQNRDIYTITWPVVSLTEPGGDMSALLRVAARQQGVSTQSRWIAGLRKTSRGTDFRSFINFSDRQNPPGVTVGLSAWSAWATDVIMPTGRKITDTPPAAWRLVAQASFASPYAEQYRGTYRLFVRAIQTINPAGTVSLRARQYLGTETWASANVPMTTTGALLFEPVDLGQIQIPGIDSPDAFSFSIQFEAYGDAATPIQLVDFILLPVDEWAADLYASTLLTGSGPNNLCASIDGITYPKESPRARNYWYSTEILAFVPRFIGGRGGLIPNETQALHSFTTYSPGLPAFYAYPWQAESIEAWFVQRYSSMRGAR